MEGKLDWLPSFPVRIYCKRRDVPANGLQTHSNQKGVRTMEAKNYILIGLAAVIVGGLIFLNLRNSKGKHF